MNQSNEAVRWAQRLQTIALFILGALLVSYLPFFEGMPHLNVGRGCLIFVMFLSFVMGRSLPHVQRGAENHLHDGEHPF